MNVNSKIKAGVQYVDIEGEMTIYKANDIKSGLSKCLNKKSSEIEIDLSQVTEIDTAGVQCLLVAKQEAEKHERTLRLTIMSDAVIEAMELFGLGPCFKAKDYCSATNCQNQ